MQSFKGATFYYRFPTVFFTLHVLKNLARLMNFIRRRVIQLAGFWLLVRPSPSCLSNIAALSHRSPDRHLASTQNVQTSYSQLHCFISLLVLAQQLQSNVALRTVQMMSSILDEVICTSRHAVTSSDAAFIYLFNIIIV